MVDAAAASSIDFVQAKPSVSQIETERALPSLAMVGPIQKMRENVGVISIIPKSCARSFNYRMQKSRLSIAP